MKITSGASIKVAPIDTSAKPTQGEMFEASEGRRSAITPLEFVFLACAVGLVLLAIFGALNR